MRNSKLSRKFGGKTEGFVDNQEKKFESAHLKAYLRGDTRFTFGRDDNNKPVYHDVKIIYQNKDS